MSSSLLLILVVLGIGSLIVLAAILRQNATSTTGTRSSSSFKLPKISVSWKKLSGSLWGIIKLLVLAAVAVFFVVQVRACTRSFDQLNLNLMSPRPVERVVYSESGAAAETPSDAQTCRGRDTPIASLDPGDQVIVYVPDGASMYHTPEVTAGGPISVCSYSFPGACIAPGIHLRINERYFVFKHERTSGDPVPVSCWYE